MSDSRPHRLYDLLPSWLRHKGRLLWTPDTGDAQRLLSFDSHLHATVLRGSGLEERLDLGSGMVTNVGVMAMANDWLMPGVAALGGASTLATQNFHGTGIGTAGPANTDIQLQTNSVPTNTTYVTGVQSVVTSTAAANAWIYKNVATINYTSTLAITEWGLFSAATVSASTGSPFTAGSATSGTSTGTALTASTTTARGHTQMIVKDTTAGTPFFGLVTSNSTSVFTVPAWYTVGTGAVSGVNPVNADVYVIQPVMWDRKVFSAINVNNLDSIQFTYSLTVQSGGQVRVIAAPVINLDVNGGGSGTTFTATNVTLPMSATGVELRWSDLTNQTTKSYVEWPAFVRPASGTSPATTFALYYFSADTGVAGGGTGVGIPGGGTPVVFTNANYMQLRWNVVIGTYTFASAPILTAYDDNTHAAPAARAVTSTPAFPNNLSGSTTDTGATARSYLKANAYGRFADVPAGAPANAPVVTDGATGSLATTSTSWLTNYQGLMADVDYITCGAVPAVNIQQNWNFILANFCGANMATGTYASVVSLKYTYSQLNAALMAMVRASGRSWWSVDYGTRSVHEWDTAPGKMRTPLTIDSRRSMWEELTKKGIKQALLCCPNGQVGAVEQPQDGRLFQFKVGFAEFGMTGGIAPSRAWCDAHVLGAVIDPEGGCQCWAWEPQHWRLVSFRDNVWDFQYRKLGRLAVSETFQLQGV